MSGWTLGRRGALSGGLAALAAGGTHAALARREQDQDGAEEDHGPFRAALLDWLREASGRLALPVSADTSRPSHTELRIRGVHPAISLHGCGGFNAYVEWDGICWDSWLWLDMYEQPTPGGWVNSLVIPEYRVVHPTLKSLWRAEAFEPLLDWINDDLARATHVALWGTADDATWAYLVRDGRMLGNDRPIGKDYAHLLPAHGHPA